MGRNLFAEQSPQPPAQEPAKGRNLFAAQADEVVQPKPQPEPMQQPMRQAPVAPTYQEPEVTAEQKELDDIDKDFAEGDALTGLLNSSVSDVRKNKQRKVSSMYGVEQKPAQPFSYTGDQSTLQYTEGPKHGMSVIGEAPELNEFSMSALKTSVGLLTEGKPEEVRKVIKSNIPDAEFRIDREGNQIAILPSGEYVFDSPGIDAQDVARTVVDALAFTPAGRAATVGRAAVASGATELGLKAANVASGGDIDEGDVEDVFASTALGGAGKLAENAISAARRLSKGTGTPDDQDLVSFAESQDVPLMTTDVVQPKTFVGKSAQSAAEKVPVTGTGAPRAQQQAERGRLVKEFTERFGEYNPQEVTESLVKQTSKVKQAAGNARQQIVDQVQDAEIPTRNAIDAIDTEIERLSKSPSGKTKATADTATIERLKAYKDDIEADPTFGSMEQLRTQFRTDVKGERTVLNNRSEAAINRIYSAMGKDLNDTVEISLGADQAGKWQKANAAYAQEMNKIKNTRLKSVLQKGELTPEVVNNLLFSNKPSEVKTLFRSLDAKGKDAARAGIIGKAVEKSSGSPQSFLNQLNKLEKSLDVVLKKEDKEYVRGLKKYLQATSRAADAEVITPTGQQLFQIAAPVSVVGDVSATGGVGTASTAMYGLMSRAYESKPVRNAIMKLNSYPAGSDEFLRALETASSVLSTTAQTARRQSEE